LLLQNLDATTSMPAVKPLNIQSYVLRLLAKRDHSRLELKRKLLQKHFPLDLIESTLDDFSAKGWQDDLRFAQMYARVRIEKGDGPLKIRAKFRECGLSETVTAEVLSQDNTFWQQQLQRKWTKKCGAASKNLASRAKQQRFLQSRGFTLEQIYSFIS
jgi:regulatory protein